MKNKAVILRNRPKGMVNEDDFQFRDIGINNLDDGEVLIQNLYLSVDPYMRGRMNEDKSYIEPFKIHQPINGRVIGEIVKSNSTRFQKGDKVFGILDWAEYVVTNDRVIDKIDEDVNSLLSYFHILGMPGLTAYLGLTKIGEPKRGETIIVSGAGGAVGMIVGQLAKIFGCKVVGITGSNEKKKYLINHLKFDNVINYRETKNLKEKLREVCPTGVDIYFDNVGGYISDEVYLQMNFYGRIVLCGQISQYNNTELEFGKRVFPHFLTRSVKLQGFILKDFKQNFEEASNELRDLYNKDKLQHKEHIYVGLENTPKAIIGLFNGENLGKSVVKVH